MADEDDSGAASDAPLPPPPPPPPQVRPDDGLKQKKRLTQTSNQMQKPKKRKDFREILALFHESMDAENAKRVWNSIWQTTFVESQEDYKKRRQQEQHGLKRKKSGEHDHGPMSTRGLGALSRHGNLTQDHLKRARQSSTVNTDSFESGKISRLGSRFQKNGPKGSKLLQKFGGRT